MRHSLYLLLLLAMACGKPQTDKPQPTDELRPATVESKDIRLSMGALSFAKALNRADTSATVAGDRLTLGSGAHTDFFRSADDGYFFTNMPALLLEVDNSKPFVFKARLTPELKKAFDGGALLVYADADHWLKFAFERDERNLRRIVTVKTEGYSEDNNHELVEQESLWLKIATKGKAMGLYYSTDGQRWNFVRLDKNDYPDKLYIGLATQSATGNGHATLFEEASLSYTEIEDSRAGI